MTQENRGQFTAATARDMQARSVRTRGAYKRSEEARRRARFVTHGCEYHGFLPPEDIYVYADGRTRCRVCQRETAARSRRRQMRFLLPSHRLAGVLRGELDKGMSLRDLAARVGLSERQLHRHLYEGGDVTFDTLDKILCRLDLVELLHLPPEMGGFDDLYETETAHPERQAA